jgi:hypothetical protein
MEYPLVFLRGINGQGGQWLALKDCIWFRSVLRYKHAIMPSLNQYQDLFRDTLAVPNVGMGMLIADLLEPRMRNPIDMDEFQYAKELLLDIARMQQNKEELNRLSGKECWPCRTPNCPRALCSIGNFYVNDRQDLFDLFSDTHSFLDFDFDDSKKVADLLRDRDCHSFLSETVSIETDCCEPLEYDHSLTHDIRGRTYAIIK